MVGKTISHYQILEKLGEGGMGVVYKARDSHLKRFVALKVLPPEKVADPERKHRFVQEARSASALNHPNIVTVHDIDQADGVDFIAMEYVEGKTLDVLIGRKGLKLNEALKYAVQIADALAKAHAAGIIHRDLKPGNVMVTAEGRVKVLDFGLAKLTEPDSASSEESTQTETPSTETGLIVGTVSYMSPEQAEGKKVDARSDIFTFGSVLYEMLTGRRPFRRDTPALTLAAILHMEPPPLPAGLPHDLEKVITRCLRKEPERRIQHMDDVKLALEEIRDAPDPSERETPRARLRILPTLVAFLLGLALLTPAAIRWLTDSDSVRLAGYKLTPFATTLTEHDNPAWSPDGQRIAYGGRDEGPAQLYVQKMDELTPDQITKPPLGGVSFPAWAPNSQEIYFTVPAGGTSDLWKVSLTGGEPVLVQAGVFRASVSPDGRTLAFFRYTLQPPEFGVWVASPTDAKPRRYEPAPFKATKYGNRPGISFAPDGRKILVAVNPDVRGQEIWVLPWPPGQPRRVAPEVQQLTTPQCSWMPNSQHVLCGMKTDVAAEFRLFMGDTETGRFWPVLVESRLASFPSVSPDGTKAVYNSRLSHYDVVEVPLDGGPIQNLARSFSDESMPAFSPLGRALVYVTNRRGSWEVWVESLSERWTRRLVSPADFHGDAGPVALFGTPVFSPDAQSVAVEEFHDSGSYLWVASVTGSALGRLTTKETSEHSATWSPDGQWIAFLRHTERGTVSVAKARRGAPSQPPVDLVEDADCLLNVLPEWSPTGEWIAYARANQPGVSLVSPDGRSTRFLPGQHAPHAWSRDGKTLYQARGSSNTSVVAVDIASGKERLIREVGDLRPATPYTPGLRITLAPDGRSLAWAVNRPRSEIWILDGLRTPRPWYSRLLGRR